MKRLLALTAFVLGACHGWSKQNTLLELHSATWNIADAVQTQEIHDSGVRDMNPMINAAFQSGVGIAAYESGILVSHLMISAILPRGSWRTAWQLASAGVEAYVVVRNHQLGY